jgi:hypothetical protein
VDQDPEGKYEALSRYGRDLTVAARDGKLDPVIGRDDEIRSAVLEGFWSSKANIWKCQSIEHCAQTRLSCHWPLSSSDRIVVVCW